MHLAVWMQAATNCIPLTLLSSLLLRSWIYRMSFLFHLYKSQQTATSKVLNHHELHTRSAALKLTKGRVVTRCGVNSLLHTMITCSELPHLEELRFIHKAVRHLRLITGYITYSMLQVTMTHEASFVWF